MKTISALKVAIDSSLAETSRIDTSAINAAQREWRAQLEALALDMQGDSSGTLSAEVAKVYRKKIADAQWVTAHVELLSRDLKLSLEQLDNLYHDLSYNLLDEESVRDAYQTECAGADSAIARTKRLALLANEKIVLLPSSARNTDSTVTN